MYPVLIKKGEIIMKRIFSRAFNVTALIFIVTVLTACNQNLQSKADGFTFENIEIDNIYENGKLTMAIEYPKEYEGMEISANINMTGMDHKIENVYFLEENQAHIATVELPMEGIWDINYSFRKDEKTYYNSFTEIFGDVAEEQRKDYTAELLVNPEPILPNQKTQFEIILTDKSVKVIENAEIKLEFHLKNSKINKTMNFEDGTYKTDVTFEEIGIYHLAIFINNKDSKKLYEEELEIPVGISTTPAHSDHSSHH